MMQILGLDTSNYTTSAALLDLEHGTVQQAKQLLPVKAGEAGLRQSDAVFHHTRQLPDMLEQLARDFAPDRTCSGSPVFGKKAGTLLCAVSGVSRQRRNDGLPLLRTGCGGFSAHYALRNLAGSESRTGDRSGGLAAGTAISLRCSAGTAGAEKPCENACASGHS